MKNAVNILTIIVLALSANIVFGQKNLTVNLLGGAIQENISSFEDGLPAGWMRSVDNFDCTVKFESGSIYFERLSPDEKCSFAFSKDAENGDYLVKTEFRINGNGYKIFLDGAPLEKENLIKVTNGKMNVGIQTKGDGKVWGWISKMTVTKVSNKKIISKKMTSDEAIEKVKEIAAIR